MKLKLNHRPAIGIMAFLIVLFTMPIGHALMILVEKLLGPSYQYPGAAILGLIGAVLLGVGAGSESENKATWLGFFGAILIWTGWVEFDFVWSAQHVGVPPLMENGEIVTKPEYLIMPLSIGLLCGSMLYFLFDGNTRCNFFAWLQRNLRLRVKRATGTKRNFAIITAMETIYILWFFYLLLLIIYDNNILGDRHPATYAVFVGSLTWSLYLFVRLIKHRKIGGAIRYAIPTVVVFWNAVEILGRWRFFKEIWIDPMSYVLEMGLILAAFVIVTSAAVMTPRKNR
jgi:hypothetical protein